MRWWRDRFEGKAVVRNLDKRKQDVCIVVDLVKDRYLRAVHVDRQQTMRVELHN